MYLHIGKNCVINDDKVIGVFCLESIEETPEYQRLYEKLVNEKRLEDISGSQKNSFILTEEKGYISGIGTNTMKKRRIV